MADLWNAHEFREGLWFGVIAAIVLLLVGLAVSARGRGRPLPIAGVVLAIEIVPSLCNNAVALVRSSGIVGGNSFRRSRFAAPWMTSILTLFAC